ANPGRILGMDQVEAVAADQVLGVPANDPLRSRAGIVDDAGVVAESDGVPAMLDQRAKAFFTGPQRLLGPLPLAEIHDEADIVFGTAVIERSAEQDRHATAVLANVLLLEGSASAGTANLLDRLLVPFGKAGRCQRSPAELAGLQVRPII